MGKSKDNIITDHTELDSENVDKTDLAQNGRGLWQLQAEKLKLAFLTDG
jgi:hypothetical protein